MKRILLIHNYYKLAGGEDSVFQSERDLLIRKGHSVETLEFNNTETDDLPKWKAISQAVWSASAKARVAEKIKSFAPDLVHFHNTFLRASPAVYYACREAQVPSVQTLHNYRLLCLNALFLREGKPCEDCLGKTIPWPGMLHRCYHGRIGDSGLVAAITTTHKFMGTYANKVDAFIALTQFGKSKFVQGGIPEQKLYVKPNFIEDPGVGDHKGGYCLFAGRLSPEKGVETLIQAWKSIGKDIPLKVVGSGPLEPLLREAPVGVEYLGYQTRENVLALMRDATLMVIPSTCYEGFPVAIPEAFATGLPVVASRIGTIAEILAGEASGWLFTPGNAAALANTIKEAWMNKKVLARKGHHARLEFETKFSSDVNYQILINIYESAKAQFQGTQLSKTCP